MRERSACERRIWCASLRRLWSWRFIIIVCLFLRVACEVCGARDVCEPTRDFRSLPNTLVFLRGPPLSHRFQSTLRGIGLVVPAVFGGERKCRVGSHTS